MKKKLQYTIVVSIIAVIVIIGTIAFSVYRSSERYRQKETANEIQSIGDEGNDELPDIEPNQYSVVYFSLQMDAGYDYEMTLYENDKASETQTLTADQINRLTEILNGRSMTSEIPASDPMQVAVITCHELPDFRLRIEFDCGNVTCTQDTIAGSCELSSEDTALLQDVLSR